MIRSPAITLDDLADGVVKVRDGSAWRAKFGGPWQHRRVQDAGHNLPQAFADAVIDLSQHGKWRT